MLLERSLERRAVGAFVFNRSGSGVCPLWGHGGEEDICSNVASGELAKGHLERTNSYTIPLSSPCL